jgi:hypothetical protein
MPARNRVERTCRLETILLLLITARNQQNVYMHLAPCTAREGHVCAVKRNVAQNRHVQCIGNVNKYPQTSECLAASRKTRKWASRVWTLDPTVVSHSGPTVDSVSVGCRILGISPASNTAYSRGEESESWKRRVARPAWAMAHGRN